MISLSPRYDLFRIALPKSFLPSEILEKYEEILRRDPNVFSTPIDYLNESIQGITIPGLTELTMEQQQHSSNQIVRSGPSKDQPIGRLNVEPSLQINYKSPANPLNQLEREFNITFRKNQGLYNYFMLYETAFWQFMKTTNKPIDRTIYVELLDEYGAVTSYIQFKDCYIQGIEGLEFGYNKTERDSGTFQVTFKYNNIDFDYLDLAYLNRTPKEETI